MSRTLRTLRHEHLGSSTREAELHAAPSLLLSDGSEGGLPTEELQQAVDNLLEFYSVLEIALQARVLNLSDDRPFFERVRATLAVPALRPYYEGLPVVRALHLRLTSLGARAAQLNDAAAVRLTPLGAGTAQLNDAAAVGPRVLFERFLAFARDWRGDPDLRELLRAIEVGKRSPLADLTDPVATTKALTGNEPSQEQRVVRGFFELSTFCERFVPLLKESDELLASSFWHHFAQGFQLLSAEKEQILSVVKNGALGGQADSDSDSMLGLTFGVMLEQFWGEPLLKHIAFLTIPARPMARRDRSMLRDDVIQFVGRTVAAHFQQELPYFHAGAAELFALSRFTMAFEARPGNFGDKVVTRTFKYQAIATAAAKVVIEALTWWDKDGDPHARLKHEFERALLDGGMKAGDATRIAAIATRDLESVVTGAVKGS